MKTRIYFLDNLRTFLIFLVIVMHAGIVYSNFLESRWIVSDPMKSETMGLVIMYLDIFVMFSLFFISGYFIPYSYNSKSNWRFLKSKFSRIIVPWIVSVFTLIPAYKTIFLYSRGLPQEAWYTYFHLFERAGADPVFFANNPNQSWLWFLPVLFLFQLLYMGLAKTGILKMKLSFRAGVTATLLIGVVYSMIISNAGLLGWFDSPILHFQRERLLIYFLVFLLGSLANRKRVFDSNSRDTRLFVISNVTLGLTLSVFTIVALNFIMNIIEPERNYFFVSPTFDGVIYYLSLLLAMFSFLYVLIHIFRHRLDITNRALGELSRNSYAVYVIHLVVIGFAALPLQNLILPVMMKFVIVLILSFLVANILVSTGRIILQRIFSKSIFTKLLVPASVLLSIVIYAKQVSPVEQEKAISTSQEEPIKPDVGLHTAVLQGDIECVRQHISYGSDLNVAEPSNGSSPLITAAVFGETEIAIALIDSGADVNYKNNQGSTALHSAAFFCHVGIVEALLAKGADKTIQNNAGSTALQSVSGPFDQVKGIYDYFKNTLGPLGLEMDYSKIQATRPKIAELLQQ